MISRLRVTAILMALAGALAIAGSAQAQVAAPRLNTVFPGAGGSFNPAVLSWSANSNLGIGFGDISVTGVPGGVGPEFDLASGDLISAQVSLVGETFSFAYSRQGIDADATAVVSPPSGGTFESVDNMVVLGMKVGDSLSVGLALAGDEETFGDNFTGASSTEKFGTTALGGVWKLGETFYVGGTYATEKAEFTGGGASAEGERNVSNLGVGWYWRQGEGGFHFEIFREGQELLEVRDAGGTLVFAEEGEANGLTLEALFGNFLIGFEFLGSKRDELDPFNIPPLQSLEEKETTVSLGWMPEDGLAIAVSALSNEEKNTTTGDITNIDLAFIGISWGF